MPACDVHPAAPITGTNVVRSAKPGDVVAIDLIELTPFGTGQSADPAGFRGIAPRVPGPDGALFAGARRPRLVRRPHFAATQPQSWHDLDDAARRLQAVLRRRLCQGWTPSGRYSSWADLEAANLSRSGRQQMPFSPMSPSISTTGLNPRALRRCPRLTDLLSGRTVPAVEADRAAGLRRGSSRLPDRRARRDRTGASLSSSRMLCPHRVMHPNA